MNDTVLNIQNVTQKIDVDNTDLKKSFGQRLREKVISCTQRDLPNGNKEIVLILDPNIQGVKDE